jgi:hypothetical protein
VTVIISIVHSRLQRALLGDAGLCHSIGEAKMSRVALLFGWFKLRLGRMTVNRLLQMCNWWAANPK